MKKKKEQEDGKKAARADRKPNWQEVYATVEDIQQYLDDRVMLRFNVVTHQTGATTSASHRSGNASTTA